MSKQLSVIPYYGGKDKINDLIIDNLDYNTDTYYELFGGGARTLLNKPPHSKEVYNDLSVGLYTLFKVIANEDSFNYLMESLYEKEYTKEEFKEAIKYRNQYEDDGWKEIHRLAREFIKEMENKYDFHQFEDYRKNREEALSELDIRLTAEDTERAEMLYIQIMGMNYLRELEKEQCKIDTKIEGKNSYPINTIHKIGLVGYYDEIRLAAATYISHLFSRDAIGEAFSSYKFKNNEAYYNRVDKLLECHYRLRDVEIMHEDAMRFITRGDELCVLDDTRVMLYCDPTYLPEGEALEGGKNPGIKYKNFWTKEQHERFIKVISAAKCKVMISNYGSDIYNKLDRYYGWSRMEIETRTSVGGNHSDRTEVLWWNY